MLNETHVHGVGGRHFITLSLNSSVGKLQSLRSALVSTSISPIGPSSSTKVPKGWSEEIGYSGCDAVSRGPTTVKMARLT